MQGAIFHPPCRQLPILVQTVRYWQNWDVCSKTKPRNEAHTRGKLWSVQLQPKGCLIRIGSILKLFIQCRYSPKERAEIGRYASLYGVAAATRYFSRKRDENVNESTIRTILKAYKREVSLNGGQSMNYGIYYSKINTLDIIP